MPDGSASAHHYRPKLVTVMIEEGYGLASFRKDMLAALTVAIVALPLSMAIAVASGVSPERGLYAAVIGGFLVSALGGSRYQIGGPAGAFIVLVGATVARFGLEGLPEPPSLLTHFGESTRMPGATSESPGVLRRYEYQKFLNPGGPT